jgi:primosomal protein N' (replication factor Y)
MSDLDVAFPRNVRALTYSVPEPLAGRVRPGTVVRAQIGRAEAVGVVIGPAREIPPGAKLKPITALEGRALPETLARLLAWMAEYYAAREGLVLMSMFPPEYFKRVKARPTHGPAQVAEPQAAFGAEAAEEPLAGSSADPGEISALAEALALDGAGGGYSAALYHAPSTTASMDAVARLLALPALAGRPAIVLAPDISMLGRMRELLEPAHGPRLVPYYGSMSRGARSEALARMEAGGDCIVLGSLQAVFAPVASPALIVVLDEESTQYKAEAVPRHHARDVAVKRASLEGAAVMLCSICPSVESYANALAGRYTLVDGSGRAPRPEVRVLGYHGRDRAIADTLLRETARVLASGGKAMLYVNRHGYSALGCADCGWTALCPQCQIPMVLHKGAGTGVLRCGACAGQGAVPVLCPTCRSHEVHALGAGMERIEEELAAFEPVGVDARRRAASLKVVHRAEGGLAVGTRTLARASALEGRFALAGVLNADAYLCRPDFRAAERAMQDLLHVAEKVDPRGGKFILQSRTPGAPIFRFLKSRNFAKFYAHELAARAEVGYPPHGRLALLLVEGMTEGGAIEALAGAPVGEGVDVLGPVSCMIGHGKARPKPALKILLRARTRQAIHAAIGPAVAALAKGRVTVDVDPLET